jgi:hypothetical protein
MMLYGEQYSSVVENLQSLELLSTSESHQATAPRFSSLMQLACRAPKLCPSS